MRISNVWICLLTEYVLGETLNQAVKGRETDCPFLCPAPYRGRENEPKYVLVTAEKVAEVLGLEVNKLIDITRENTKNLFPKMK